MAGERGPPDISHVGDKDVGYGDTSTQMWKLYATESDKYDRALVSNWKSNTDSMLIFTGLFSAIVSAFLIETYKTLQPDTGTQTTLLLSQLIAQSDGRPSSSSFDPLQFSVPASAIRVNILMFISLFFSVTSALVSTLVQQWARDYLQYSQPSAAPHKRGRVRAYLFQGLSKFQMRRLVYGVPVLLHVSVFLFFFALSEFLHTINSPVGVTARYSFVGLLAAYLVLSIVPLIARNSPYQTALTTPLQALVMLIRSSLRLLREAIRHSSPELGPRKVPGLLESIHVDRTRSLIKEIGRREPELDRSAVQWLMQELDDDDMDAFLKGLPGYLDSPFTDTKAVASGLAMDGILPRISEHFTECITSLELSEEARFSRALACVGSLRMICETAGGSSDSQRNIRGNEIQTTLEHLESLYQSPDHSVALRALCIRGLVIRDFLSSLSQASIKEEHIFPQYLLPLYSVLSSWRNTDVAQWSDLRGLTNTLGPPPSAKEMLSTLLHDGPIMNVAVLAHDILFHASDKGVNLEMSWKTMELLLKRLSISQARASDPARTRFHDVLSGARNVQAYERGRIGSLLESLKRVVRGLRLAAIFAHPPAGAPKLSQSKVEALFGWDQLRNGDLFESFATHLRSFVQSTAPDHSSRIIKELVIEDRLWGSLHENLSKCFQHWIPFPVKMRIVTAFFDVMDVIFAVLGDSSLVDWLSPEFSLLMGHISRFDGEVTPGELIERGQIFRVTLFSSQVVHRFLTQFSVQKKRGDPLNHLAISTLAVIYLNLGVGTERDMIFWDNFLKRNTTVPDLMGAETRLLDEVLRDAPLRSFCMLEMLAIDMARLEASEPTNSEGLKQLWRLLRKIVDSQTLELKSASLRTWHHFDKVRDIIRSAVAAQESEKIKEKLRPILEVVEEVFPSSPSFKEDATFPGVHAPPTIPPSENWPGNIPTTDPIRVETPPPPRLGLVSGFGQLWLPQPPAGNPPFGWRPPPQMHPHPTSDWVPPPGLPSTPDSSGRIHLPPPHSLNPYSPGMPMPSGATPSYPYWPGVPHPQGVPYPPDSPYASGPPFPPGPPFPSGPLFLPPSPIPPGASLPPGAVPLYSPIPRPADPFRPAYVGFANHGPHGDSGQGNANGWTFANAQPPLPPPVPSAGPLSAFEGTPNPYVGAMSPETPGLRGPSPWDHPDVPAGVDAA